MEQGSEHSVVSVQMAAVVGVMTFNAGKGDCTGSLKEWKNMLNGRIPNDSNVWLSPVASQKADNQNLFYQIPFYK